MSMTIISGTAPNIMTTSRRFALYATAADASIDAS